MGEAIYRSTHDMAGGFIKVSNKSAPEKRKL